MSSPLRFTLVIGSASLLLAGCQTDAHAPTVDVLGSYFPAWMVCIVLGVMLSLITRQLILAFKLAPHLRPAPLLYLSLTILFTLAVWLMFFRN
jgi:hypothetical protein